MIFLPEATIQMPEATIQIKFLIFSVIFYTFRIVILSFSLVLILFKSFEKVCIVTDLIRKVDYDDIAELGRNVSGKHKNLNINNLESSSILTTESETKAHFLNTNTDDIPISNRHILETWFEKNNMSIYIPKNEIHEISIFTRLDAKIIRRWINKSRKSYSSYNNERAFVKSV